MNRKSTLLDLGIFQEKSLIIRFSNQNKNDAAIGLYFQASKMLLKHQQINSGFGLA
jgi:hypothetical protein